MVNFESKAGEIKKSELDLSKIYASKQNALDGINNVTITEGNTSWNTGNLTYQIQDDNQTVVISNGGVPIGFTTVDALVDVANSGAITPGEMITNPNQTIDNADYQRNIDDIEETPVETPPTTGAEEQTVETTYDESPADEVKEEHNTPLNSGESAPSSEQVIEAEVDEAAAAEIAAETQQPPEPPVDIESLDAEVEDSVAQEIVSNGTAQPSDFSFKHEDSNILAAKARNMGFTDDQIRVAIGISRWETGNYQHLAGGYNYGGVSGSGDAGSATYDGHVYAQYSSKDAGMDAFLINLKTNYYDQGLTTPEAMSRKYLGYEDNGSWTNGVKGCMG